MTILEVIIALVAIAIMSTARIQDDIARHRTAIFTAEGQNEQVINAALATYQTNNTAALLAGSPISGFANPLAPQLSELVTAKILKAVYNPKTFWGATYVMQISVVPTGCSVAASTCHLSSALYPSTPLTRGGSPDVEGAGEIALAGGNLFGFSSKQNPGTVTGINGAFTTPNPLTGAPAAAIVAINGYGTDGSDVYIRRDGSLTWTGNQDVNGVDLNDVGTVNAQEVAASSVVASGVTVSTTTGVESVALGNNSTLSHIDSGNQIFAMDDGGMAVTNAAGNSPAPLSASTMQLANIAIPRTSCSKNGLIGADSDGSGLILSCQFGEWAPIGGSGLRYNYYSISTGSTVPAPNCPGGGIPQIVITGQNFSVDTTAAVNFSPVTGTGPWTFNPTDGSGVSIAADAIAETYCAF